MSISVVIPVYNEEKYITPCLESLMKQREHIEEIIVVDNNSTDKSMEIASKFPVTIVKEPIQGIITARNKGFDEAKGSIIVRTDADTRAPVDWTAKIKRHFKDLSVDAVTGPFKFYDFPLSSTLYSNIYTSVLRMILGHYILTGFNMAIRKTLWDRIKNTVCMDNSAVHEDIDLALHIVREKGTIVYDPNLMVEISSRRLKRDPLSFFIEYPHRLIKTLHAHK
ncbi:glycosyltransferase [Candidatus Roizmanbacteria bacterium]|nr:glycosyltransferase [Candidatus Roizmanbacteria bacterium]